MSSAEGLHIAEEKGLDLVKISPQATPPVCKLMNYGKYRFERSKKEKEARKNQHVVEIKEIRMSPGIDVGGDLLKKFAELCADVATMDKSAKMEGRLMSMFLSPKAQKAGK